MKEERGEEISRRKMDEGKRKKEKKDKRAEVSKEGRRKNERRNRIKTSNTSLCVMLHSNSYTLNPPLSIRGLLKAIEGRMPYPYFDTCIPFHPTTPLTVVP
jgi:hypothetical protein